MMDASQVQPAAEAIFSRFATRTFRVFGASYLAPPDLFQRKLLDVCTCSGFPTLAASCCLGRQPLCCLEILSDGRLHSTLHMDLQTLSASSLRYRWGLHKQCCPMRQVWNPSPEHSCQACCEICSVHMRIRSLVWQASLAISHVG